MAAPALPTHALTLRNPFAWAIDAGLKTVEYRSWRPPEGVDTIAIHAGSSFDDDEIWGWHRQHPLPLDWSEQFAATEGRLLCVVRILAIEPDEKGGYAWRLKRLRALPRLPVKGQLRLWRIPPGVRARLSRRAPRRSEG
jgi:hypothetical protein